MNNRRASRAAVLALFVLAAAPARAQTQGGVNVGDLGLSEAQVRALNAQLTAPVIAPGISFGSPVGFGAGWGQAFAGIGGQTVPNTPSTDPFDGSITLGLGLGDPNRWAGLEAVVTIVSLKHSFAEDGNLNLKLHRAIGTQGSVAIGVDSTSNWGAVREDESTYVVYTHVFNLVPTSVANPVPLALNVGLGDGRFVDPGDDGWGPFGSIAIVPIRQASLIADWTGRDLNIAISTVPLRRWPVVLTIGAVNLTERFNRDTEFAGGIGYLYRF